MGGTNCVRGQNSNLKYAYSWIILHLTTHFVFVVKKKDFEDFVIQPLDFWSNRRISTTGSTISIGNSFRNLKGNESNVIQTQGLGFKGHHNINRRSYDISIYLDDFTYSNQNAYTTGNFMYDRKYVLPVVFYSNLSWICII